MDISILKKKTILFLVIVFYLGLNTNSQDTRQKDSISLKNFLETLGKNNGWNIIYSNRLPSNAMIAASDFRSKRNAVSALNNDLKQFDFKIVSAENNDRVALQLKTNQPLKQTTSKRIREVRGKVIDSTGAPLIGVTVEVKDNNIITTTDLNGNYILEVMTGSRIVYSMGGFKTQSIKISSRNKIDIILHIGMTSSDDAIVAAFGQQKNSEAFGSTTIINPRELKAPSNNLTTALAGRLAGMIAYQGAEKARLE